MMGGILVIVAMLAVSSTRALRIASASMRYQIRENSPVGTMLGIVAENRPWTGVTYQFGAPSQLFQVDPMTSELVSIAELDAEKICALASRKESESAQSAYERNYGGPSDTITCSLTTGNLTVHLDVNAIQADGSLRAVFKVSVDILDLDDNQPQFDQPVWQRQLKEALYRQGRRIDLPKARDRDLLASHRIIHYRLEPDDPDSIFRFEMSNMDTPSLVLRQDLDAESQESFSLVLIAFNPTSGGGRIYHQQRSQMPAGSNESRLQINIAVVDMNDNEPYFEKPVVNITVPEDQAVGSVIYRLTAHDADRTARLVYSLAANEDLASLGGLLAARGGTDVFEVDKEGRVTLQRRLDFEKNSHYRLPVRVSDGEFTADATLHVLVGDVNDEAPRFEINPTQLVAEEGAPPGRSIGRVRVFDPDSPEVNGVVRCAEPRDVERRQALAFFPDLLTNPSAGVYDLRTRVILDREGPQVDDGKEFIRLVCWDGNQQSEAARQYGRGVSFTATMTATLTIRDINDNAPVFSQSIYHVQTPENNQMGAKIFQVTAYDADSGVNSEIIYSLLDHANFRVDPVSGWITASVEFDREKRDSYQVTIVASDKGEPRRSSSVLLNLTIEDVNDNQPSLLPCGEFDRTSADTLSDKSSPHSLRRGNTFAVRENAPVGTFVGQLLAEDADSGRNGEITFRLLRRHGLAAAVRFELLANGSMYTALPLDREETANYQLMVEVADKGGSQVLSSTGIVCVTVLDDNDNAPHFVLPDGLYSFDSRLALTERTGPRKLGFHRSREDQSDQAENDPEAQQRQSRQEGEESEEQRIEPSLRISLHETNGQLLTRLEATDPDEGVNGQVDYSLTSHPSPLRRVLRDSDTILAVNPTTGEVRLARSLTKDDMGSHLFVVSATDRGQPAPRVEKKLLLVRVEDIPPQLITAKGGESSSFTASTGSMISLFHLGWGSDGKNVLLLTALIAVSVVLAVILISAMICMLKPCSSASRQRRSDQHTGSARFHNGRLTVGGPSGPAGIPQEARLIDSSMETFPDGAHDYGYGYTDPALGETLHQTLDGWEDQSNTFPLPRMVTTACTGTVSRMGPTCSPVKEVADGCSLKRTMPMPEDEQVPAVNTLWEPPHIVPVTLLPATCLGTSSFDKRAELLAIPTNCKPCHKLDFDVHLLTDKDRTSDSGQGGSDEEPHESLNLQPIVKIVQIVTQNQEINPKNQEDGPWLRVAESRTVDGDGELRTRTFEENSTLDKGCREALEYAFDMQGPNQIPDIINHRRISNTKMSHLNPRGAD